MKIFIKMFVISLAIFFSTMGYSKTLTLDPTKTLKVVGVVDKEITQTADELETLAKTNEEVTLVINSPGGSVMPGLIFIDRMEIVKQRGTKIRCVVSTLAASMAMHILAHCDTRYAFENTLLLWHPMRVGGMFFSVTQAEAAYLGKMMAILEDPMNQYLYDSLGIPAETFWLHYKNESLLPASWVSQFDFIEIVQDVQGIPNLFSFEDDRAVQMYKAYLERSPGLTTPIQVK